MSYNGWNISRPRPAPPFLSRIILCGLARLVIMAVTVSIANSATVIETVHGAVAAASLTLGIGVGAVAVFLAIGYFMLSGRWPWQ